MEAQAIKSCDLTSILWSGRRSEQSSLKEHLLATIGASRERTKFQFCCRLFVVHRNGCFRGWERKNEYSVHKKGRFRGRESGIFVIFE